MTKPIAVPASARIAVAPVAAAFVRRTDSVPSTTQKPCWTRGDIGDGNGDGRAPRDPRMLLTNHTERTLAWVSAAVATLETRLRASGAAAFDPAYQRPACASSHSGSARRDAISAS